LHLPWKITNYISVLNHFVPGFLLVKFLMLGITKPNVINILYSLSQFTQVFEKSRSQLKLEAEEWRQESNSVLMANKYLVQLYKI
jgi:hypothetical protein